MSNSDELLVRSYDVDFGDFVYARIPDGSSDFHILIDCGTSESADPKENPKFKSAFDHMRNMLPEEDGKKRLDLLVVTHPHADHIKGFDPTWFEGINVGRIWLSAFMKENHPQALKSHALQDLAEVAANALLERRGLDLGPALQALLLRSIGNEGALSALRQGLAQQSDIYPQYPLYVARDIADPNPQKTHTLSAADQQTYGLAFEEGTTYLRGFAEGTTRLRILAPEWDIDGWYLGKDLPATEDYQSLLSTYKEAAAASDAERKPVPPQPPDNISERDFQQLRSRVFLAALAFSHTDKILKNNTSLVLLLEWRGRRLLFTGDAEWKGREVEQGKRNYCWDVMLHIPQVRDVLLQRLDFLKVGHHGSLNGTPFVKPPEKTRLDQEILDLMLPEDGPDASKAHVVVSTLTGEHGDTNEVPYADLLLELGCRAANRRKYSEEDEKYKHLDGKPQPQRTDREPAKPGEQVRYIDVLLPPAPGWTPQTEG